MSTFSCHLQGLCVCMRECVSHVAWTLSGKCSFSYLAAAHTQSPHKDLCLRFSFAISQVPGRSSRAKAVAVAAAAAAEVKAKLEALSLSMGQLQAVGLTNFCLSRVPIKSGH